MNNLLVSPGIQLPADSFRRVAHPQGLALHDCRPVDVDVDSEMEHAVPAMVVAPQMLLSVGDVLVVEERQRVEGQGLDRALPRRRDGGVGCCAEHIVACLGVVVVGEEPVPVGFTVHQRGEQVSRDGVDYLLWKFIHLWVERKVRKAARCGDATSERCLLVVAAFGEREGCEWWLEEA